ncbi:murein hydrolase activator EnvC family protein [Histidinibacterium lentulum]|uniref:Peptidase M23 n=1 Tax=Histidinibacterium lentulum TaxID=2480588 RepID=A0A3N2R5I3_9RHOB|nr:peptidoglycan DD-metalloendopeptidase family protein [Histidinibacterium lentulum]ROU02749.1 peptidase M23 [Histidinibacterium lentulum]
MIRAVLALCLLLAWPAAAQDDPARAAAEAAARLEEAARLLDSAEGGRDRVEALTATLRAYEDGLAALRDGLRRAAIRARAIELDLAAREAEVSRLLGVLSTLSSAPAPLLLLHPSGPTGTARSGMILSDVTPALHAEAEALRSQLEELALLRLLQDEAAETLSGGLAGAQEARAALSEAIAERTDLPRRFSEDRIAMAALLASADTLAAFAEGLPVTVAAEGPGAAPPAPEPGSLPLPVEGTLLRGFDQPDAAGIRRPGWILAARPGALVTAPAAATIRYAGPLLDYGQVVIVEPGPDLLIVLAGLATVYGTPGEVVPAGTPLGLMGGAEPADVQQILTETTGPVAGTRSETLYVEVRNGQSAVDPAAWFASRP